MSDLGRLEVKPAIVSSRFGVAFVAAWYSEVGCLTSVEQYKAEEGSRLSHVVQGVVGSLKVSDLCSIRRRRRAPFDHHE